MSLSTYKKRSGVSDRGKDYEWLLCAFYSLIFSTSPSVTDFELFTNNEFFGDFDDVTLRVKFSNGLVKNFLLQLKHSEKTKSLTLNSLTSPNGDCSLPKYIRSYQNVISLRNFYFILYVNKTARFKDKTKVSLESKEIRIRQHFCVGENLLNTSQSRKCSVFRLQADEGDFFDNFYLYVNQQNDVALKQSISDLLKTTLHCDVYTTFVEFIRSWWAGNFKLTKSDVVAKLAELVLSPMVKDLSSEESNDKTKLIQDVILQFDLTLVQQCGRKIASIWSKLDDEYDIKRVSLTSLKFGLTTKGIGRMDELSLEKKAKVLWFMDEVPLLVEVDSSKKEQIDAIIVLLGKCEIKKRIILVGYCTQGNFTDWKVFRDLSDIFETNGLRKRVTQALGCSLQGKKLISLEELGAYDSKITSTFRVDQLLEIATSDNFNIGEGLETLPPLYIPRRFYKVLLTYKAIDGLPKSTIFLSYNGKKSRAENKFNKRSIDISNDHTKHFPSCKVFVCDSEFDKDKVVKELTEDTNHVFRVVDGQNLQWLDSTANIEELEDYKKCQHGHIFDEHEVGKHFWSRIRILTSHTGTGKTTFLSRVKNESPPNCFVVKMDLKDHIDYFTKFEEQTPDDESSVKSEVEGLQLWDYIVDFTRVAKNYDDFETELLRNFDKKRVVVLWDSLDDLYPELVVRFVNTVLSFYSTGVTQWIAAQNNYRKLLETTFATFVLTMVPFTQEEQISYIQNRCGVCDDQIITSFMENMTIIDNHEYLGVPLQLFVMGEIFSNSELIRKTYTLTDMLAAFIDAKYNHYLEMIDDLKRVRGFRRLIEDAKSHRLAQYKIAAMKTYLPQLYQQLGLKNCAKFVEEVKEGDFLGLIERVDQENFVFGHQILGEFFSAWYLANNIPDGLEDYIFEEDLRTIRFMFDLLLAENQPSFVSILYKKYAHIGSERVKDKGGRNLLHLVCSYGVRHPFLKQKEYEDGSRYLVPKNSRVVQEDSEDLKRLVKYLCQVYDPGDKDTIFGWTSFDYADRSCSLGLLECLLEIGKVSKLESHTATVLYYSIKFNYSNLFASVKQLPFVEDTNRDNLIHLATKHNRDNCLNRLLSQNVYKTSINKVNEDKWSPLHVATFNGNLPLIKLLINKGASFMLQQPSPMSLAVAKGYKDIVEFFLECGCSPNEFYHTNHFTTSIFQAISQKHNTILELLLRNGAKLYSITRSTPSDPKPNPYGMNLFHMLLENEQFNEAEMVLTKGVYIDSADNEGRTAFHHAALNNQERVVRYLLAKGGNYRLLDKNGRSPMHWAAKSGSVQVAKILLDLGVDPDLQDSDELSPLHIAVLAGNIAFVGFLIQNGGDLNVRDKYGRTPMHLAALYDLEECLECMHQNGGDLEAREGLYGRTPLHLAAWRGNEQCVRFLLDQGIPVDCRCNYGFTPLHLAVEEARMDTCQVLLAAGASVSCANRNGHTPLNLIKTGYLRINRAFVKYDPVPLHSAVASGNVVFVEELLGDFDVNGVDGDGNTPLHVAVRFQILKVALVETLVKRGGDVKIQNRKGFTPLHYALQNDFFCKKTVTLLLDSDAINTATVNRVTPLHIAAQNSFAQYEIVVKDLLELGAKTDAADDLGFTPLHYASSSGNLEIVSLLVEADSNVNRRSKSGRTPLHLAATRRHLTVVNYLLKHGASIMTDLYGVTPLDEALLAQDSQIFKILHDQEPDFDVHNKYLGRSILHVAAKNGSLDLVKFFLDKGVGLGVDFDDSSVLEEALYNRHYDVFEFLLNKSEFDVNKYSKRYGKCPLHVVTSTGTRKLVDLFLDKGARIDAVDDDGNTPLHIAVDCNQTQIFLLLLNRDPSTVNIRNKNGKTVLHKVMLLQRTELISTVMSKGADVDAVDNNGSTPHDLLFYNGKLCSYVLFKMKTVDVNKRIPWRDRTLLHLAVDSQSTEIVNWLKQKGASINCVDMDDATPLHYAVEDNSKLFHLLVENWHNSIDLEKQNKEKETVLHLAARKSPEMVTKLLQLGASPHATTKYGATPLFYALQNPKCFKILWEKTPEVQIFNVTGHMPRTVLHIAASQGDLNSVKFFLQVGLKINEADTEGKMPLDEAAERGYLQILEVLLESDTTNKVVNICRRGGRSLLHLAALKGNFDLVKLLVRFKARTDLCDSDGKTAADIALERGHKAIYSFLKTSEDWEKPLPVFLWNEMKRRFNGF